MTPHKQSRLLIHSKIVGLLTVGGAIDNRTILSMVEHLCSGMNFSDVPPKGNCHP